MKVMRQGSIAASGRSKGYLATPSKGESRSINGQKAKIDIENVSYAHEGQPQEIYVRSLYTQRKLSLERF